jgi:hypothetical protein
LNAGHRPPLELAVTCSSAAKILVSLVAFACTGANAIACSSKHPPTDAELFERADEVFIAKITATKLARFGRDVCDDVEECEYVRGDYELVDSFKGKPHRRGYVSDVVLGPGNCSLGLVAGWYYVFYVTDEYRMVLTPGGSFPIGSHLDETRRSRLEAIAVSPHARPIEGDE